MNKIWIIGIGGIVVVGLIVLAFILSGSNPQTQSPTGQIGLPMANSVDQTSVASGGEAVQANDILKDPATVKDPANPGYYYLGYHANQGVSDPTATANPPYVITYIDATKYFNIALLQEPIGAVREEMQQYLMEHLGITQAQMCQLDYMVSVPNYVNSSFSGRNLGFSFCPGATQLPK